MNDFISKQFQKKDIDTKNYIRISINIKWFSSVLGRTLIYGKIRYMSNNNFRTNKDLNNFMENYSPKDETIFIILKHSLNNIKKDFKDINFFPKAGQNDILNADHFFYSESVGKIKFKRNKPVNIKIKQSRLNNSITKKALLNVHLNLK